MAKKNLSRTASPMAPASSSNIATDNGAAASTEAETEPEPNNDVEGDSPEAKGDRGSLVENLQDQAEPTPNLQENEPSLVGPEGPESEVTKADESTQADSDSLRPSTDAVRNSQSLSDRPSQDFSRKSEEVGRAAEKSSQEQEELNQYIERIDALQAKLHYLSKEAAESARKAAVAADAGSLEKKILEKDEKIALLMDEGQRLSKTEMNHLTLIKKLRAQIMTYNKEQEAAKLRAEKAERSLRIMEDRARKAEAASKRAEQVIAANAACSASISLSIARDCSFSRSSEACKSLISLLSFSSDISLSILALVKSSCNSVILLRSFSNWSACALLSAASALALAREI